MVLKYTPVFSTSKTGPRSGLRYLAVAGAAFCGLSFSACDQLTGDETPDTTGGGSDVSGNTDTNTPISGINPDTFRFGVLGGKNVEFGGIYEPMTAQGLKPYSFWMGEVRITNSAPKTMKIVKVELIPLDDTLPNEWTLRESQLEEAPLLNFQPFELAEDEGMGLAIRYFPQQTRVSQVRLVITDDNGDQASIIISGRCRDYANISKDIELDWSFNFGHANSQSKLATGALATDAAGNSYISGNATQWGDQFNHNIVVAAFNPTGGVSWAKEWNEPFAQEQQDDGQNGQTGGGMGSIAIGTDADIYVAGRRSTAQTNNTFQALVLKVRAGDGSLAWSKGWVPEAEVDVGAEAYAVDATISDRVLVTGVVVNNAGTIFFGALSKATGEPLFAHAINVGGGNPRGYGVAANAAGDAYVVGQYGGGAGFVMRFTGCNTATPTLEWVRGIGLGVGGSAHNVAIGADGSAYVGFDVRGAATLFAFARFDKNGNLSWAKYYDERDRGDVHTQYAIKEVGTHLYVGGRIGLDGFDYTGGDGLLLSVAAADGSYEWASIFYTGTTASTNGDHRVKGFSFSGDKVHVLMHNWVGPRNFGHYWGHWYDSYDTFLPQGGGDGAMLLGDLDLNLEDLTADESTVVTPITTGRAIDIDASTIWGAPPSAVKATPTATMTGNGSHYTAVIQQLTIRD